MDFTKSLGNITELMCMAGFIKKGYQCSIPYGDSAKYDFIVDVNNKFWRIQCKTSHIAHDHGKEDKNAFSFSTTCQTTNTKYTIKKKYSKDDIDYFATYYDGNVYLIPVEETSTNKTLRFSPPLNGSKTYNRAEDYLLDNVLSNNCKLEQSKIMYINRKNISSRKWYCENCGKEVSRGYNCCPECSHLKARKINRPDRDSLKNLIRTNSFKELSRMFNVSDKTISKWCISYKLPSKKLEINKISDEDWKLI